MTSYVVICDISYVNLLLQRNFMSLFMSVNRQFLPMVLVAQMARIIQGSTGDRPPYLFI